MARRRQIKTPADMLAKWQKGGVGGAQRWNDNIQRSTANPGALAAMATDKAISNYTQVVGSPAFKATLQDPNFTSRWKAGASNPSAQSRYSGAFSANSKGAQKYDKFSKAFQSVYQNMRAAADSAGTDPVGRFAAALAVLQAASRRGSNPVTH